MPVWSGPRSTSISGALVSVIVVSFPVRRTAAQGRRFPQ
jgi:hypothetical protein